MPSDSRPEAPDSQITIFTLNEELFEGKEHFGEGNMFEHVI